MKLSAHQLNYLPYPGLIAKINFSDVFIFLTKIQFQKKSWHSRNQILNRNKPLLLSVPIKKNKLPEIREVEIDNNTDWKKNHLKNIYLSYKKSKYFKEYIGFFEELYSKNWIKLEDINIYTLKFLMKELDIKTKILNDKDFNFQSKNNNLLIEMCQTIGAKSYISNKGSQSYVNLEIFKKKKIDHYFINYKSVQYNQNIKEFTPNLSIFDMLFFCGKIKTQNIIKDNDNLDISKNYQEL
tara:strand:+ start:18075 stop:18791 length:717 start_codon:yes stop_codon:yes gene_type:complete